MAFRSLIKQFSSHAMGLNESSELSIRLFQLICLTISALAILVVLPVNVFQNLPMLVNVGDVLLGAFAFFCYWNSIRGRHYKMLLLVFAVVLLEPIWFLNGGANGSITLYFMVPIIYPIVMFRGVKRWVFPAGLILNICALLVIEHFFPWLSIPFRSQTDRTLDLITGALCSCLCLAVIIWVVITNYERSREHTEKYARDLQELHRKLTATFDAIPDLLFVLDSEGRICEYHCTTESMYVPPEVFIGKNVRQVLPSEAADVIINSIECAAREGRHHGAIYSLPMPNGRNWYELSIAVKNGVSLQDRLFVAIVRNITNRKQAEEALAAAHRQIQSIIDKTPALVYAFDLEARLVMANAAIAELVNSTPEQMIGKKRHAFMPSEDADWHEANDRQVIQAGRALEFEEPSQLNDRVTKWLTTKFPLRDAQGRIYAVAGISVDITERKRAELELQNLHQELAFFSRNSTISELAASIAHEINQPLAAILSNSQVGLRIMQTETPDLNEIREILSDIAADDRRAVDVIQSVRSLLKEGTNERQPISINDMIADIIPIIRSAAVTKNISINLDLNSPIPLILGNRIQLQQVILNLASNAIEAMEFSAPPRSLKLKTCQSQEGIKLDVSDTGPGIPADRLASIFEPFFTTKANGLGMGLSLSRSIVTTQGGRLWAENNPEGGAIFHVTLPATSLAVPVDQETKNAEAQRSARYSSRGQKVRILMVDDQAIVRRAIANLLRTEPDIEVVGEAASGKEAVDMTARLLPDIVLMDYEMADVSGVEATETIHKEFPDIKIIGLSSFAQFREAMLRAGATSYLSKNLLAEDLIGVIRNLSSS